MRPLWQRPAGKNLLSTLELGAASIGVALGNRFPQAMDRYPQSTSGAAPVHMRIFGPGIRRPEFDICSEDKTRLSLGRNDQGRRSRSIPCRPAGETGEGRERGTQLRRNSLKDDSGCPTPLDHAHPRIASHPPLADSRNDWACSVRN